MSDEAAAAYERAAALCEGRRLDPLRAFALRRTIADTTLMSVDTSLDEVNNRQGPQLHLKDAGGSFIFIGRGAVLPAAVRFHGMRNVVMVGPHADASGAACVIVGDDNILVIGAFTTAQRTASFIVAGPGGRIVLGEDCVVSDGAILANSDGHAIFDAATGLRVNADRDIHVEDHVLIGRGVRVNKGTHLGTGSIVDHHSTVHGTVPPNTLVSGVPARAERAGVTWSRAAAATLAEAEALAEPSRIRALRAALPPGQVDAA